MIKWPIIISFLFFLSTSLHAQSLIDDLDSSNTFRPTAPELVTEKVEKISASGRIFILTNNSGGYGKGDFISIVLDNQLVNRAIVAKTVNGSAGIKIIKVYSDKLNGVLRPGMDVQIIRGDDSYFSLKKEKVADNGVKPLIEDEDELFDDTTLLEDDLNFDENKKRAIKTDNLVSVYLALVEGQDTAGASKRYSQFSASWAYQIDDNIYTELGVGRNVINDYPSVNETTGLDTTLTSIVLKVKYTLNAPFYSFIQPYIGYQIISASYSADDDGTTSDEQIKLENEQVEALNKNQVVAGITILKRLVPGWFGRLDLGTDSVNLGFSLEF